VGRILICNCREGGPELLQGTQNDLFPTHQGQQPSTGDSGHLLGPRSDKHLAAMWGSLKSFTAVRRTHYLIEGFGSTDLEAVNKLYPSSWADNFAFKAPRLTPILGHPLRMRVRSLACDRGTRNNPGDVCWGSLRSISPRRR
jgi:hypothetical protein